MISASLLQEAFPKAFRPIILVTTSLLKGSVGKNQSLYFSVLSVPPWCFFFLAISTRRRGEHEEIRPTRGSAVNTQRPRMLTVPAIANTEQSSMKREQSLLNLICLVAAAGL